MAKIKRIRLPNDSTAHDLVDDGAARYDEEQSLTESQKSQARSNIDASATVHNHATLKIGNFSYNGSTDITIPVYDGETKL